MDINRFRLPQNGLLGAIFLMATSAIGPGFLTQTAVFTEQLKANFGFVILISTLLDIIIQGTIWRVITWTGQPASHLLDQWFPKAGIILTSAVVLGGVIFNIGNLAGAGLGLHAIFPTLSVELGAGISAIMAFFLLWKKSTRPILDLWTVGLGLLFLGMMAWGLGQVSTPWKTVVQHTFLPTSFHALATLTLVGGTVGGYISFVGAHRLIEAGQTGPSVQKKVWQSAAIGILITSLVRFSLFALLLGLLDQGNDRSWATATNPIGQAFTYLTANNLFFGLIMWSAAITSAVGATYTSFTFLRTYLPQAENSLGIGIFLLFSWVVLFIWGKPAQLLIGAGTMNALVLPFGLSGILWVAKQKKLPIPFMMRIGSILVIILFIWLFFQSLS